MDFSENMNLKVLLMMIRSELSTLVIFLKSIASGGKQWFLQHRRFIVYDYDYAKRINLLHFVNKNDNSECFIIVGDL